MMAIYEPSLCLVLQGAKTAMLGTSSFRYDSGQYLVVAVDLPLVGSIIEASEDDPYIGLMMTLDLDVLRTLLLDMPVPAGPAGPTASLTLGETTPELLDALVRLMRLLDRPEDIPVLAPLIEQEILYRLARGPDAEMLRQLAAPDSRLSQVNRAIAWIKTHFSETFSIETAAATANMSPSSFFHHFKAVTSMSPLQYQKQIRLHEARRLILAEQMEAAKAGFEVGYDSPSQFSREYKRLFGAPPISDVARFRRLPRSQQTAA